MAIRVLLSAWSLPESKDRPFHEASLRLSEPAGAMSEYGSVANRDEQ